MKLTATQRLLAGLAVKLRQEQLDVLKSLCTLPEGVKASIATPIKFLTVLRQNCVTVAEFIRKLEELLSTGSSFNDLQTFGRLLYAQCGENDLCTRATHFPVGMVVHRPSQRQCMSFNSTLLKISENITPDAVEIMRTVTPIPDATKERVRNGHNLFSKMKDCGCISENDTEFLEDLLREMKLIRALEVLEQYKQNYPPVVYPPFVPLQPTSATSGSSAPHSSRPTQGNGGVARMVSTPEEGGSSPQLVLGRNYARTTSGNYSSSMSSGNFSSMPSEGSNSMLSGSSGTMASENSSSLSSGDLNSFRGNLGSGYSLLDDRSLLPSLAPLSSNRLPHQGPPSDTSSCDDFRTAPCSPAMASPPIQSHNPVHFNRSVSFSSPCLGSSGSQHYASSPHTPTYTGTTVRVPLDVTPRPTQEAQPGHSRGQGPKPSAPSLQVVESLERPPPANPHFTPRTTAGHSSRGFPSASPHDPRSVGSSSSGCPPRSGGAVLPPPHPGVSSRTTNSNLNSNVSAHHSSVSSPPSSMDPGGTSSHAEGNTSGTPSHAEGGTSGTPSHAEGGTSVPQQRQDTGPHELVQGPVPQPVSLPGVFIPQSVPRRTSPRLAALPTQSAFQRHRRTSRPGNTSGPQEVPSQCNPQARFTPSLQSIPSHTLSHTRSEPNTTSYTGSSENSYPGDMEGVFPSPTSVQDVRPNPRVSEIGRSEESTHSLPSYPADFEHQFSVPMESQHPGMGGAGASNGYHGYQARPNQNGTPHGHNNWPQAPVLHLNPNLSQQESIGVKRFVNQAGNPEGFGSIPTLIPSVPIHQSPEKTHLNLSGGAVAQCSEPSPVKQLYPALPVRSLRKRKGETLDSQNKASGTTPSKRSKKQAKEARPEEEKGVSASKSGYIKGMLNNFLGKIMGSKQGGDSGSQNEEQKHSLDEREEEDDEDFHSCNDEEEEKEG